MKERIYSRLQNMYRYLYEEHLFCIFVFMIALIPFGLFWTVYHQVTGTIPKTQTLNLLWLYTIHLPFGVSRLFDLFAIPTIYLIVESYLYTSRFYLDLYEELDDNGDMIMMWITVACIGAMFTGVTYFTLWLLISPVILAVLAMYFILSQLVIEIARACTHTYRTRPPRW